MVEIQDYDLTILGAGPAGLAPEAKKVDGSKTRHHDVRKKTAQQVSTAIGDGALAAINAKKRRLMQRCGIEIQPDECQGT